MMDNTVFPHDTNIKLLTKAILPLCPAPPLTPPHRTKNMKFHSFYCCFLKKKMEKSRIAPLPPPLKKKRRKKRGKPKLKYFPVLIAMFVCRLDFI